jgi:hypothetical protein
MKLIKLKQKFIMKINSNVKQFQFTSNLSKIMDLLCDINVNNLDFKFIRTFTSILKFSNILSFIKMKQSANTYSDI